MEEHLQLLDGPKGNVGEHKVRGTPNARISTQEGKVVQILESQAKLLQKRRLQVIFASRSHDKQVTGELFPGLEYHSVSLEALNVVNSGGQLAVVRQAEVPIIALSRELIVFHLIGLRAPVQHPAGLVEVPAEIPERKLGLPRPRHEGRGSDGRDGILPRKGQDPAIPRAAHNGNVLCPTALSCLKGFSCK